MLKIYFNKLWLLGEAQITPLVVLCSFSESQFFYFKKKNKPPTLFHNDLSRNSFLHKNQGPAFVDLKPLKLCLGWQCGDVTLSMLPLMNPSTSFLLEKWPALNYILVLGLRSVTHSESQDSPGWPRTPDLLVSIIKMLMSSDLGTTTHSCSGPWIIGMAEYVR